ncbi:MAG: glycosyltransferase family 39 protein [Actinomycetota bacterium]|nr:glycosyltransferase family 39 protein [Actinomycetota bacterium]
MTTAVADPVAEWPCQWPARAIQPATQSRRRCSVLRGSDTDPRWVRPAVLALLAGTAVLYLWGLGASGWANTYYSAAVQAATKSWKAFFFGASDAANSITVDKAPAFLWPMAISARIFGLNSWSVLVPQAIEGVAAVGLLYAGVRRWFTPAAGLLAGAVLAITPVASLMFRFNNPDSMLVLLLTAGAYAMVRSLESARTRWVILAFSFVGFGFLAKMLQTFLVVPAFGVVYLIAAPTSLRRRIAQLAAGAVALIVSAGWWVVAVELTPASARPYIGGSQNNSLWNLIFGYNGFGRLTGAESGSVGGAPQGGTGQWGPTGWSRLFNAQFGGQASWLLPAALILLAAMLAFTWRSPRTNRPRAAMLLWGGWLLVTAIAISFGRGIIHPYYTLALAPAIGAIVGIGSTILWKNRRRIVDRLILASVIAITALWSFELLGRTSSWHPSLRILVLVSGIAGAVAVAAWPWMHRRATMTVATVSLLAVLAGPAAYTWATVSQPHSGAIPSAGPVGSNGPGGGPGRPGRLGGGPGGLAVGPGGGLAVGPGGGFPGARSPGARSPGTRSPGARLPGAGLPSGGFPGGRFPRGGPPPGGGGGVGGILNASTPNAALTSTLKADAGRYTWVAAAISANQAAGYQLATGDPVMAIGGFNGTDPSPTLAQFQKWVAEGRIHYFIAGGQGANGNGDPAAGASAISSWVSSTFSSSTVGGVTLYDLTVARSG